MDNLHVKNNYIKIFWIFIVGSIIGTFYEEILNCIRSGNFESRASVIYGPFNIEYGAGLALFAIILGKNNTKRKWYYTFIMSCLIGGVTEFLSACFIEKFYNMRFWNYEGKSLNIYNKTTGVFIICWGVVGVLFMKFLYPLEEKLINKIKGKILYIVTCVLSVFMFFNILISFTALYRYNLRAMGNKPKTYIGALYDKYYTDEVIKKVYSNMEYLGK